MKVFELSMSANYLPNWDEKDGIREIIQNAVDAKTEFGGEMNISYDKDRQVLKIVNTNCVLPLEALLIGHTTKLGRTDMRGQFGEGFKFGINVLENKGNPVKIRSGSQVWSFEIAKSRIGFNSKVLFCKIADGRKEEKRVAVEISNISQEIWEVVQDRFLCIGRKYDAIPGGEYGEILTEEKYKGKLFVKGIYIGDADELCYGYNFFLLNVDRDRKMVDYWSRASHIFYIWNKAVSFDMSKIGMYYNLLEAGAEDVVDSKYAASTVMDDGVFEAVRDIFLNEYGADAFPVMNHSQAMELGHVGKLGVVVREPLLKVLKMTMGTFEDVNVGLAKEIQVVYAFEELSAQEQDNLMYAIDLVSSVEHFEKGCLSVVDFRSANIYGMAHGFGANIELARKILSDRGLTLRVLVHEVAHKYGNDGDKSHVSAIENIWQKIFERMAGIS